MGLATSAGNAVPLAESTLDAILSVHARAMGGDFESYRNHALARDYLSRSGRREWISEINVERIAGNMLVQHYVEDIADAHHVRVNSLSDSFTDAGATQLAITWELRPVCAGLNETAPRRALAP